MSEQEDFEDLSRRLAGTDFSADSRVRAGLRARLLRKGRPAPRLVPPRVAALSLASTAAVLVFLFPFRASLHRAEEVRFVAHVGLPAEPARTPAPRARASAATRTVYPRGDLGLPVLPGRLAEREPAGEESPISTRAVDRLIEIHRGRAVSLKDGSAVVWEIDGADYRLETRRITLDDIFETRPL